MIMTEEELDLKLVEHNKKLESNPQRDCRLIFCKNDFSEVNLDRRVFTAAEFIDCTLVGSSLKKATLVDCNFYECSLQGLDFTLSVLRHCKFSHSGLEGAQFTKADLHGVKFLNSHFSSASLIRARIDSCSFEDCKLMDKVDLTSADILNIQISGSNFNHPRMSGVSAEGQSKIRNY